MKKIILISLFLVAIISCSKKKDDATPSPPPTPTACFTTITTIEMDQWFGINDCSTNTDSYQLSLGDGSASINTSSSNWLSSVPFWYDSVGTFNMTLTATNANGSNSTSKTINVTDPTAKFVGNYIATRTSVLLGNLNSYPIIISELDPSHIIIKGILGGATSNDSSWTVADLHPLGSTSLTVDFGAIVSQDPDGVIDETHHHWTQIDEAGHLNGNTLAITFNYISDGTNNGSCYITATKQ